MKKLTLILVLSVFVYSFSAIAQIKVGSTGFVGINNSSPTYQLDVSGSLRVNDGTDQFVFSSGDLYTTGNADLGAFFDRWVHLYAISPVFTNSPDIDSDISFKKDINDLTNMSAKINLLKPVRYKLKARTNSAGNLVPINENQDCFGFIAQEMVKIFPEIVNERENGTLGIRYTELIPILVKTIQEQQAEINDLKARIEKIELVLL
ncbi:MAG: tail fiber domain-containing protein [Prolixibacteraceae bacterium]|jgi:hypothetical protein